MKLLTSLNIGPIAVGILLSLLSTALPVGAQQSQGNESVIESQAQRDFRFASGQKAPGIPFETSNNLIFVQMRVNKSEPLWFVLDTGASYTFIKQRRAQALSLKVEKNEKVFEGQPYVKGVTLTLPGVELLNQNIVTAPTAFLEPSVGRAVDGILGYDIFHNFVVEIDYSRRLINLSEPRSYQYKGAGASLPITIEDNTPFVHARIKSAGNNSAEGKFMIDTGANNALNIFGRFDNAHNISKGLRKTLQSTGLGVSGAKQTRIGRIEEIHLGRVKIKEPVVSLAQSTASDSDEIGDGEIGAELLRRFKVIVDYSRGRIILESNAQFTEPYEASLSGASITAEGLDYRTYRVRAVIEDSPATEAGLRVGDVITAIDGKPASDFTFEQLRQMLRQDGRQYDLSIKRVEEKLQIKIKLRRLI
ncbi:MAG TPA: aspartyl protease family protein [Pyrinomonadaceae bacterium]|jgi:predicted aspartyl protease|nr:aspartyl protease family protein [Pyrinomonadaceae bacterium]